MNGLPNHIYNHIINKWYHLFTEQNYIHSDQKYEYWKNVKKLGVPNEKDEKWKYIPLNELFSHKFINTFPNHNVHTLNLKKISLNFKSYRLVFINGFFSKKFSSHELGPWKIRIINRNIQQILPKPIQPDFFLYLNECLSYETIYISLPHNTISSIPLYLLHINQGSNIKKTLTTFHYRHHIEIHHDSSGEIIEHYTSKNKESYFNNSRMSIMLGANARAEHTKLSFENRKSYHISHNDIHLNYNSTIQSNIFNTFGSHFIRHQTSASLNDKLSSILLNSLLSPLEQDISDISTYVQHNHPGYSSSKQIHKIISGNQGQGIFRGLIQVHKQAIKIDGKMINKNLLLDPSSKIYSMPQLEIYADDVVCNHGATIGHINYEQIFYLCSRGLSYQKAYQIIIYAFAFEIINNINNNDIQKKISNRIIHLLTRTFYDENISHKENSI